MSLFVLSDTHLSLNSKTEKLMDVFGSRWKNYISRIEYFWRLDVGEDDTVVIPGDISWAMTLDEAKEDFAFLDSLPGKKIIGKGNHDYWWSTASKIDAFFSENGITTISLLHNNAFRCGEFCICGTRGWFTEASAPTGTEYAKIVNREAQRLKASLECGKELGGEMLVFLHFPPLFGDFRCGKLMDVLHEYGVRRLWYGHMHGQYSLPECTENEGISMYIASADYLQFRPIMIK